MRTQLIQPVLVKPMENAMDGRHIATILVVDDERTVRNIAALLLQRHGYRTLQADSGMEAISICEEEKVDLVLSDVRMPGMDGIRLGNELRARHAELPVVFMSGYIPEECASSLSRSSVLSKPFTPVGLLEVVRRSLAESRVCRAGRHIS